MQEDEKNCIYFILLFFPCLVVSYEINVLIYDSIKYENSQMNGFHGN